MAGKSSRLSMQTITPPCHLSHSVTEEIKIVTEEIKIMTGESRQMMSVYYVCARYCLGNYAYVCVIKLDMYDTNSFSWDLCM